MSPETIIQISIAVAVIVIIGIKVILHKVVKFKMDESAILNLFKEAKDKAEYLSAKEISESTDIDVARILEVCNKSTLIKEHTSGDSWCLTQ